MNMQPSNEVLSPSTVNGVIQFQLGLDSIDISLFSAKTRESIINSSKRLPRSWIKYSATKIWEMKEIGEIERFGKSYQENTELPDVLEINVMSFLETAFKLKRLSEDEKISMNASWNASADINPEQFIRSNVTLDELFWGIHYIDYHLGFLNAAFLYNYIDSEEQLLLQNKLLSLDPKDLTFDQTVKVLMDDSSLSNSGYGQVKDTIEGLSIKVDGNFINIYSLERLVADLNKLASKSDLYIDPGFGNGQINNLKFIKANTLLETNKPEIIVECLIALTSFPCSLGQGNIVKTHSLFPGEKAVVTIETFSKQSSTSNLTSSVLDSINTESKSSFTNEVNFENTYNQTSARKNSFSAGGQASANWGWGSASISANSSSSSSRTSESAVRNLNNALNNQSASVSNNRTVKIETDSTEYSESSTKQSIVRTIENINVSKPLNFVFKQLTQSYLTLTTIKDLRIVLRLTLDTDGTVTSLEDVPDLLASHFDYSNNESLKEAHNLYNEIVKISKSMARSKEYGEVEPPEFIVDAPDQGDGFDRKKVNDSLSFQYDVKSYKSELSGSSLEIVRKALDRNLISENFSVPYEGILLKSAFNTIKTEGVTVDCFLSASEGLDEYSKNLQIETIEKQRQMNCILKQEARRLEIANNIVEGEENPAKKVELFERLMKSMCNSNSINKVMNNGTGTGNP